MKILNSKWHEYELLDSGYGNRLERFGEFVLSRPDPQCIWKTKHDKSLWEKADAIFIIDNKSGKGRWVKKANLPEKWLLRFKDIKLWVKLSTFKHTGVFPEQAAHWEWLNEKIINSASGFRNNERQINVLNLFGYTGIASLVCVRAGAKVTHVDASRPAISWARENQLASALTDRPIRWIVDDVIRFTQREVRRGTKYDGIIMDPPVYGHGPHNEIWDFNQSLPQLLDICKQVITKKPLFILINAYAVSASSLMLHNLLDDFNLFNNIESGELIIRENSGRLLSTGIFVRGTS